MSSSTPLSSFRVRPRFSAIVPHSRDAARHHLLAALAAEAPDLAVHPFPEFVGLHIADAERRQWSPRLQLHLEPQPDGTTRIDGVYGPEIEIWSIFLYGYLGTGMLGTFSAILGGAQYYTHAYPWGFWIAGAMALGAAGLYLAALLGQKFGACQTCRLHLAWEAAATRLGAQPVAEPAETERAPQPA